MSATPPDKDIDQWLKLLVNGDAVARQKGEVPTDAIHQQIKHQEAQDTASEAAETERDWQRLQFRMRREQTEALRNVKTPWYDLSNPARRNYAMAAAVTLMIGAGLIFGPPPTGQDPIDATVMRGAKTEVLRTSNVKAESEKLLQALNAAGAKATLRTTEGKTFIDIVLERPVKETITKALETQAIAIPEKGNLVIQFVPQRGEGVVIESTIQAY